jgi:hypothetical protein
MPPYEPKLTKDVTHCFVLRTNRSLIGFLHDNDLRHSAPLHYKPEGEPKTHYL